MLDPFRRIRLQAVVPDTHMPTKHGCVPNGLGTKWTNPILIVSVEVVAPPLLDYMTESSQQHTDQDRTARQQQVCSTRLHERQVRHPLRRYVDVPVVFGWRPHTGIDL